MTQNCHTHLPYSMVPSAYAVFELTVLLFKWSHNKLHSVGNLIENDELFSSLCKHLFKDVRGRASDVGRQGGIIARIEAYR